jgi:acetolactate synthase-1/3 small subunit
MTIQTVGDAKVLEQIEKQLHKLVDVLRVSELGQGAYVEREVMLVKIQASGYGREEVKRNADIFRGQIIDVTPSLYTVQLVGTSDKLDAFLASVRDVAKIVEVARSGLWVCHAARKSCVSCQKGSPLSARSPKPGFFCVISRQRR